MAKSLAIKYRPRTFDDVVEQGSIRTILQQQLQSGEWKHAYLFCGGAGTGKTTCARIFANELNEGQGNAIELDAASNNGVDDVREIIKQAKTKSLDSKYKCFIIDECHAISNAGWQAFLKIIEEPPATSIFLFCTTDPQKIPKTILSRVQRYDFQKISMEGIVNRLHIILDNEGFNDMDKVTSIESLQYIAKLAQGGMRDAITYLDKCISYSTDITLENVVAALGTVDYDIMFTLTDALKNKNADIAISIADKVFQAGKDIKQFVKQYTYFLIDVNKYCIGCDWEYINLPRIPQYVDHLNEYMNGETDFIYWVDKFVRLDSSIKYSASPLYDLEALILIEAGGKV